MASATEKHGSSFTAAEETALHDEDFKAARNVFGLMVTIFLTAVLMYSTIAILVRLATQ